MLPATGLPGSGAGVGRGDDKNTHRVEGPPETRAPADGATAASTAVIPETDIPRARALVTNSRRDILPAIASLISFWDSSIGLTACLTIASYYLVVTDEATFDGADLVPAESTANT